MKPDRKSLVASLAVAALWAGPAFGHAADQGFVLLLPTTAYITGGTLAVAATILLLSVLRPGHLTRLFRPCDTGVAAAALHPGPVTQGVASCVLAALILVGLAGPTDPQANLLPLVLWTVWWMALFVVQGYVFDIWTWVNPWPGLHRLVMGDHPGWVHLPERLSVWPAVVVFAAFQGFVLADAAPNDPGRLAGFALGYWAFTLVGMALFGRRAWLTQVECFTVLFQLIGTMRAVARQGTVKLGVPGWLAAGGLPIGMAHAIFVLVLLAAGSFDGLHETFFWLAQMGVNPLEYPGRSAMVTKTTLGLFGAMAVLSALYGLAVWLGLVLAGMRGQWRVAFVAFSVSLLPIAIGYHFAHYFVTFLVQVQVVLATLADPLARGWSLPGFQDVQVKVGFLTHPPTVKAIWLTQAGVVVASHVLAVFLSHRAAEKLSDSRWGVLKLQTGLSLLMVAYTIFGLWLLASPRGA